MSNPYRRVHRWTRHRSGGRWNWVFPVGATALASPWTEAVLLGFLEQGRIHSGLSAVAFRLAVLVAGAMCLHTYTDLVRGSDRPVLDPHPVQARALIVALAYRTGMERIYLPLMGAVLLFPVGMAGHWTAFGAGLGLVVSGYWVGLGVGLSTHLAAVWASQSRQLATLLDAIRGDNPTMQAALIYAPGFALGVAGVSLALASAGMESGLDGWRWGWVWMVLPLGLGGLGLFYARQLADRFYVRTTAVLGEIDSMYAGIDAVDDDRAVYLEWLAAERPEILRALRHGWRGLRSWPIGAWVLGAILGVIAFSKDPDSPEQIRILASAGVLLIAAVALRMAARDPRWLDQALGVSRIRVAASQGWVAFLYAQGVVIPAAFGLWIRHREIALHVLMYIELIGLTGALLAAFSAWGWRGRGVWAYGPLGIIVWAIGLSGTI